MEDDFIRNLKDMGWIRLVRHVGKWRDYKVMNLRVNTWREISSVPL
jgi:hypothetical protein